MAAKGVQSVDRELAWVTALGNAISAQLLPFWVCMCEKKGWTGTSNSTISFSSTPHFLMSASFAPSLSLFCKHVKGTICLVSSAKTGSIAVWFLQFRPVATALHVTYQLNLWHIARPGWGDLPQSRSSNECSRFRIAYPFHSASGSTKPSELHIQRNRCWDFDMSSCKESAKSTLRLWNGQGIARVTDHGACKRSMRNMAASMVAKRMPGNFLEVSRSLWIFWENREGMPSTSAKPSSVVAICRGMADWRDCWRTEEKTEGASLEAIGPIEVARWATFLKGTEADGPVKAWQNAGSSARNATRTFIVFVAKLFWVDFSRFGAKCGFGVES
jgi:hypothetical protein